MMPRPQYEHLAGLLDYPGLDYMERVRTAQEHVGVRYSLALPPLDEFAKALPTDGERLSTVALDQVQEVFTRSFDVQAVTTLSVGYVMFGDDYKRGELLVNLSREQEEIGIDCGSELPDHLPNILRLIARWEDGDLVRELVEELLHPALERMIAEFGPERIEQRDRLYRKHFKTLIASSEDLGSVFRRPLAAIREVLRADFDLPEWQPPEENNDFLRSIGQELDIEAAKGSPTPSGRML